MNTLWEMVMPSKVKSQKLCDHMMKPESIRVKKMGHNTILQKDLETLKVLPLEMTLYLDYCFLATGKIN